MITALYHPLGTGRRIVAGTGNSSMRPRIKSGHDDIGERVVRCRVVWARLFHFPQTPGDDSFISLRRRALAPLAWLRAFGARRIRAVRARLFHFPLAPGANSVRLAYAPCGAARGRALRSASQPGSLYAKRLVCCRERFCSARETFQARATPDHGAVQGAGRPCEGWGMMGAGGKERVEERRVRGALRPSCRFAEGLPGWKTPRWHPACSTNPSYPTCPT